MNLRMLQKSTGKTIETVSNELGIPKSTYNKYLANIIEPNIDILKKLSNYFNVSIDYLVDNNTNGKVVYSEEQRGIFNMVVQLNKTNTLKAYSYIAGLLAGQG